MKVAVDIALIVISYFAAFAFRFELTIPESYLNSFLLVLPAVVLLYIISNAVRGIYSNRWKYASFDELLHLVSSVIIGIGILTLLMMFVPGGRKLMPVSVAVTGGVITLFSMAFSRLQYRLMNERRILRSSKARHRVLLIGAGDAGETIARDMLRHPEYDYLPVGFIDDDPAKSKLMIKNIPVLGKSSDIADVVEKQKIDEIFITMPSIAGGQLRKILGRCEEADVEIKILPSIYTAMTGDIGVSSVRELRLEDLLGRDPVETDIESISAYVKDKAVLVTGAGGSIGSELSRQLCRLGPKSLLLLDKDETHLFDLDMELVKETDKCPTEVIVADIRDAARLESIFKKYHPQILFHSAALKHVPMMQAHPSEAIKSNVMGTRNLARLSSKYKLERFILISTDKAVHPANVMGATKRLAEYIMQYYNRNSETDYTAVRFGNVLGSRGSVVPIFQKQIEEGGPVQVTHPEMARYFMTIPEAARLVIQAGAYTEGGDTFILDMGEPVKIIDLAEKMIRLLGKGRKIEIQVNGLRPGEKLSERLLYNAEEMRSTEHPKISKAVHELPMPEDFELKLEALIRAARMDDDGEILRLLSVGPPYYQPEVADDSVEELAEEKMGTVISIRKRGIPGIFSLHPDYQIEN